MALLSPVRRVLRLVMAFALPPRCPGCGIVVGEDHSFCLTCWQSLDFMGGPSCAQCGVSLPLAFAESRCGACLADPPPFDRVIAAIAYGAIGRTLALKLKYGRRPGIARTMARLMRRSAGPLEGLLVVPVPLHRRRLWWRGYNQAALIARALAKQNDGTLALHLLLRHKSTPLLRGLGRSGRRRALAGAFSVADPAAVRGQRIVLVDDVFTSGATAAACARVLKRAGAAEVRVACWARVVQDADDER